MNEYLELKTIEERINWLQKNGSQVSCEEVIKAHLLKGVEVTETDGKSLTKTWGEIEKLIAVHDYEFYVSFEIEKKTDNILDLLLISKFVQNPPCYSTKLFRCIAAAHNLKDDSELVFFNANVNGEQKVAIKVEDSKGISLYNLSTSPY